jgi:hypothetical protein
LLFHLIASTRLFYPRGGAENLSTSEFIIADFQSEGICSIGSGAVESGIKQIDRRVHISGAQWKTEHVPQVLARRAAYLNGLISP